MGILRAPLLLNEPSGDVTAGSLKIKSGSYLSRTFGTGNSTTWTFSCWVKRCTLGTTQYLFRTPNVDEGFYLSTSDKIDIYRYSGSFTYFGSSQGSFKDPSGWTHIVYAHDSTRESGRRLRLYINGVFQEKLDSFTDIGSGNNYSLNSAVAHRVGEIDGYMAQCYFIDGLALPPFLFGFTDPLTNTWKPRRFREKGLPTVNDGTSWTSDLKTNNGTSWFGGSAAANVFDGTTSTFVQGALNYDVTFTPSTPIPVNLKLRIWADGGSGFGIGNGPYKITYNGTVIYNERMWESPFEVEAAPGTLLTSLKIEKVGSGEAMRLYAIEVDGVIMKNSTTKSFDFGTNGFYLPMDDEERFHLDQSGNNNHFTKTNFSGTSIDPDVVKDSPSGAVFGGRAQTGITTTSSAPSNYCTWNPLNKTSTSITTSEGNLKAQLGSSGHVMITGNMAMPKGNGKYYWEIVTAGWNTSNQGPMVGIVGDTHDIADQAGGSPSIMYRAEGVIYVDGSSSVSGQTTFTTGDVIGVALDLDRNNITWYKNGSQVYQYTSVSSSVNSWIPAWKDSDSGGNAVANWGQKPFKYAPPQGFLPLNTASVTPVKVIPRSDQYVGVATYKGDASIDQIISADKIRVTRGSKKPASFNPDWVWVQDRFTNGGAKWLFDSVRGSDKYLQTNSNSGQGTRTFTINNSGVRIPSGDGSYNLSNSKDYFAMYLKAGGSSNTFNVDDVGYGTASAAGLDGGSINPTGASVGTKQGFSIITITTPSAGAYTVSHGLTKVPDFIIYRIYDQNMSFYVWHQGYGAANEYTLWNSTAGTNSGTYVFNNTLPTASVITDYSSNSLHHNEGRAMIYYSWHNVPGLQKFGTFHGSRSGYQDYVHLGFKPAVVWLKRTDNTGNWAIFDDQKSNFNTNFNHAIMNGTPDDQGQATGDGIDILSNGFTIRSTNAYTSTGSQSYIYCAWASMPTSTLSGGQSNTR